MKTLKELKLKTTFTNKKVVKNIMHNAGIRGHKLANNAILTVNQV